MTEEQINEVMRLVRDAVVTNSLFATRQIADMSIVGEAKCALVSYLRTIGEPESVNAELLEALKGMVDAHAIPSSYCKERPVYDQARAAIARAESAIESPAKVSPCAGHAVQQEADEAKICATCRFLTKNGGCQSKGTSYNCVDYCQWEANESGGA